MAAWEQWFSHAVLRGRALFRRGQMDRDLNEEFQYHLDRKTEELLTAGIPLPEARRVAHISLGGLEQAKEECRDSWGLRWIYELAQDVRYGARLLRKAPGFTFAAVCMLGTAIGAIAVVFSLLDAILLRPLPFRSPSDLVLLSQQFGNQNLTDDPFSAAEVADLRNQTRTLEDAAAFRHTEFNFVSNDVAERVIAAAITPNLFDLLGAAPLLGRTLNSADSGGDERVVVISETLWRRRFAADSEIVGRQIRLSGRDYSVVGVMPERFRFPLPRFNVRGPAPRVAEIWTPTRVSAEEMNLRSVRTFYVVGRLGSNSRFADFSEDLKQLGDDWARRFPEVYGEKNFSVVGQPLREAVTGRIKPALWILVSAVLAVLVIALFNLAAILLARSVGRRGEFALRMALGAGRNRVGRQLIAEGLLLAVLAAAAGLVLAAVVLPILRATPLPAAPLILAASINGRTLLVIGLTGIFSGLVLGIIPAMAAVFGSPSGALQNRPQTFARLRRWDRVRDFLVIGEIALGLVLLFCAISLIQDFTRLRGTDLGFDATNVLTMEISVPPAKYPDDRAVAAYFCKATEQAAALPEVQAAAFASVLPLSGANQDGSFTIEGAENSRGIRPDEEFRVITPEYFRVLAIPLRSGRVFTDDDSLSAPPVVIINQALAQRYWPAADALGKRIRLNHWADPDRWMEVVGIVGNIRHKGIDQPALPEFYLPHAQQPVRLMSMMVKTNQSLARAEAAIRRELRAIDPEQPISNIRPLRAVIGNSIAPQRLTAAFVSIFATVALMLGMIGLYSVMSFHFAERKAEIAMRLALGAERHHIVRLVLRRTLRLVALGGLIGCAFVLVAMNSLARLIAGAHALDARTFVVSLLAFLAAGFGAALIPAFRVTRADQSLSSRFC
jgi:putative ABC transport system permease protein